MSENTMNIIATMMLALATAMLAAATALKPLVLLIKSRKSQPMSKPSQSKARRLVYRLIPIFAVAISGWILITSLRSPLSRRSVLMIAMSVSALIAMPLLIFFSWAILRVLEIVSYSNSAQGEFNRGVALALEDIIVRKEKRPPRKPKR